MVRRACELRGAGWTYERIAELLNREFNPPQKVSKSTVYRWTGEGRAEAHRERERQRKLRQSVAKSGGRLGASHHTPEYRLERMVALHNVARLPLSAIARLMTFDYGEPISRRSVERAVTERRLPAPNRRGPLSISREEQTPDAA
jgi:transposase